MGLDDGPWTIGVGTFVTFERWEWTISRPKIRLQE
jgi:hypothetical protein